VTEVLVLASKSAVRAALLRQAGLTVETRPADLDERAVERSAREAGASSREIAVLLARAKAEAVSRATPGRLVLGADQTLDLDGVRFSKPADRAAAAPQRPKLRGGALLWTGADQAKMTMRPFSDAFLEDYLEASGAVVATSVGGYQLEGIGVQLFSAVEGDHFTILGLPLLQVLEALRRLGALAV
jgi:septum formation protein